MALPGFWIRRGCKQRAGLGGGGWSRARKQGRSGLSVSPVGHQHNIRGTFQYMAEVFWREMQGYKRMI